MAIAVTVTGRSGDDQVLRCALTSSSAVCAFGVYSLVRNSSKSFVPMERTGKLSIRRSSIRRSSIHRSSIHRSSIHCKLSTCRRRRGVKQLVLVLAVAVAVVCSSSCSPSSPPWCTVLVLDAVVYSSSPPWCAVLVLDAVVRSSLCSPSSRACCGWSLRQVEIRRGAFGEELAARSLLQVESSLIRRMGALDIRRIL